MTEKPIALSRRKILAGIGAAGVASVGAGLGTSAYFSDTEGFENNSLVAGSLDMKVGWDEHYFDASSGTEYGEYVSGSPPSGTVGYPTCSDDTIFAVDDGAVGDFMAATRLERFPEGGLGDADPCEALTDVPSEDLPAPLIELSDVKPGDFGEVTFSFSLCDNPGYVWLNGGLVSESENGVTEPEPGTGGGSGSSGGDGDTSDDGVTTADTLSATPLTDPGLSPEDLAETLIGDESDVEIVDGSVSFSGGDEEADERGGGTFTGGSDAIDLGQGVVLSSGQVVDMAPAEGDSPNENSNTQTVLTSGSDDDLDSLTPGDTDNASILEFDFTVPDDATQVFFTYVFGSEEYNEYVGSDFNDVFGFFVNGENVAEVPDPDDPDGSLPAAINNINNGSEAYSEPPTNPDLYINNDPFDPDSTGSTVPESELANTEMDGFTVPLTIEAEVNPGETNTMKLAIADTTDAIYDSWVFIEGGTLDTEPPEDGSELPDAVQACVWYDDCDNVHQDDEEVIASGSLREVLGALSGGDGVPLDGDLSTEYDELEDPPDDPDRECFSAADDVHCLGFEWWVPTDVGNEIQTDSVEFDLGFYAEQCRHNDGSGSDDGGDGTTGVTITGTPSDDDAGNSLEGLDLNFEFDVSGATVDSASYGGTALNTSDVSFSNGGATMELRSLGGPSMTTDQSVTVELSGVPTGTGTTTVGLVFEPDDDSSEDDTDSITT